MVETEESPAILEKKAHEEREGSASAGPFLWHHCPFLRYTVCLAVLGTKKRFLFIGDSNDVDGRFSEVILVDGKFAAVEVKGEAEIGAEKAEENEEEEGVRRNNITFTERM